MNLEQSKFRKNLILFGVLLSLLPFIYLLFSNEIISDVWYRIANVCGFIGTIFILWQFILGVRGFSKWLTADYDWVIKIHTFLGINGGLFVILHPILETIYYKEDIKFIFQPNFTDTFNKFLTLGKFAFILFLFIWFSSSLLRKALQYRLWLYIHYLSYPMAYFVLVHPLKIGSIIQASPWVFYYWIFICLIFLVILVIKILDIFCLTYKKYTLAEIKNYPGNIFTLRFRPQGNKPVVIKPGQYFYIKTGIFSEAHPFSVLEYDEENEEIIFGIKKLGRFSTYLGNSLPNSIHYIDGPYGEFTFEGHNQEPKIILAGGIGITPFYEVVSQFNSPDTYLFYANKNLESALYRDKFKKLLKGNYYDFIDSKVTPSENVFCEIISANKLKEILAGKNLNEFKFFICGSPGFTNAMISCVLSLGVSKNNIFIEEFEY